MPLLIHCQVMPRSRLRATPTPCVAANSVPSTEAVTALTKQPANPRCDKAQRFSDRESTVTPSTVPTTIASDGFAVRCVLSPPLDNRIMPILPDNSWPRDIGATTVKLTLCGGLSIGGGRKASRLTPALCPTPPAGRADRADG